MIEVECYNKLFMLYGKTKQNCIEFKKRLEKEQWSCGDADPFVDKDSFINYCQESRRKLVTAIENTDGNIIILR